MTERADGCGTVATRLTGCLELPDDEAALVVADLVYSATDCLAVTMEFCGPEGAEIGWTFGWELLSQGLVGPAGEGDIRIRPVHATTPTVEVVLTRSFAASVRFPAKDVGYFVSRVRELAPLRNPRIHEALDEALAAIMEET